MGTGIANFAHKAAMTDSTYLATIEEYDLYYHFIAGLISECLSCLQARKLTG